MSDRPMHSQPGAFEALQRVYAEGELLAQQGDFEGAVAKFSEGLAIDDHFRQRYVTMYAQRAFALQRIGRLQEAIADYGRAIEMEPDINRAQYFFHRGMCWAGLDGHTRDAVADYTASIALHDGHPGPFHLRGKLYALELGEYAAAIADFDHMLAMRPNPEALRLRGFSKMMLGDYAGGLPDVVASNEMRADPHSDYLIACACAVLGHDAAMYDAIGRALAVEPEYRTRFLEDEEFTRHRGDPRFAALVR